jgi:hypothetical protein
MSVWMIILMICLLAALNRLRGTGVQFTGKGITSPLSGVVLGGGAWLQGIDPMVSVGIGMLVGLGVLLWSVFGWGRYFVSFSGYVRIYLNETEVPIIDRMTDWLFRRLYGYDLRAYLEEKYIQHGNAYIGWSQEAGVCQWGVIAMGLRGLMLYPAFIILAVFNPWSLLIGLGSGLQGVVYGGMRYLPDQYRDQWAVSIAEWLWGAVMGVMFILVLGGM